MLVFEWDDNKEKENIKKHGISFSVAQLVFYDINRVIENDDKHSYNEKRWFCYGFAGGDIITVRFTMRGDIIRIFGAAYWRSGRKFYEKKQKNIEQGEI